MDKDGKLALACFYQQVELAIMASTWGGCPAQAVEFLDVFGNLDQQIFDITRCSHLQVCSDIPAGTWSGTPLVQMSAPFVSSIES